MENTEKNTAKKLKNKKRGGLLLIAQGITAGAAAGLVCVLYRFLLSKAEEYLYTVLDFVKGSPLKIVLWIALLALIGIIVSFIIRLVPDSGGSGIPTVAAEIKGYASPCWWKVIAAKLFGSTLSVFSGLCLGREGPSIQFGAMAAKGAALLTRASGESRLKMISSGAGAGLAAAFNAPLAGVMFVVEELRGRFDKSLVCTTAAAAVTADFVSKLFFGQNAVFNYRYETIPLQQYWMLILFGVLTGIFGAFYNTFMIWARSLFCRIKKIPEWLKFAFVFAVSAAVGLLLPQVLCGGHTMAVSLVNEKPPIAAVLVLFAAKFLFGAFSFGSGAPGGTLYPMCILGAYAGVAFAQAAGACGLDAGLWQSFAALGMAGLFASAVRAPITGIILVFEITGNISALLPLAVVSLVSCAAANLLGSTPFYTALENKQRPGEASPEQAAG